MFSKICKTSVTALFFFSAQSYALVGLCPTPSGPIGIIPCDVGCTGASFINSSAALGMTYTEYVVSISKTTGKVSQCTANELSGAMKQKAKISSISAALKLTIELLSIKEIDAINSLIIKIDSTISEYETLVKGYLVELTNNLKIAIKSAESISAELLRYEKTSNLTPTITSQYLKDIVDLNKKYLNVSSEVFTHDMNVKALNNFEGKGFTNLLNKAVNDKKVSYAESLFDFEELYFSSPALKAPYMPLYTTADILLLTSLAKAESACIKYTKITDAKGYSCLPNSTMDLVYIDESKEISDDALNHDEAKNAQGTSEDVAETVAEKSKQKLNSENDATKKAFDDASNKAFKPVESFFDGGCLDGLKSLNIDLQLLDPRNLGMINLLDALKDYLKKTACAVVVAKTNEELDKIQDDINEIGTMMEDDGLNDYGIGISASRSKVSDGKVISAKKTINQVQNTKAMNDMGQAATDGMNRLLFGGADMDADGNVTFEKSQDEVNDLVDGRNNIDFSDDKYYGGASGESTSETGTLTTEEMANGLNCFFSAGGCNE